MKGEDTLSVKKAKQPSRHVAATAYFLKHVNSEQTGKGLEFQIQMKKGLVKAFKLAENLAEKDTALKTFEEDLLPTIYETMSDRDKLTLYPLIPSSTHIKMRVDLCASQHPQPSDREINLHATECFSYITKPAFAAN